MLLLSIRIDDADGFWRLVTIAADDDAGGGGGDDDDDPAVVVLLTCSCLCWLLTCALIIAQYYWKFYHRANVWLNRLCKCINWMSINCAIFFTDSVVCMCSRCDGNTSDS